MRVSIDSPYSTYSNSKGYFLKQHGSIDWNYCNNKECRAYGAIFPLDEYNNEGYYCAECHTKLDILIVPPLLNKKIRSFPLLNKIWNLSAQEIFNCQRLIIWGYSFPPTDFYSKWLISKNSSSITELIIINPELIRKSKDNVTRNAIFYENVRSLFSLNDINISFYEYFSDFAIRYDINKKYNRKIF